MTMNTTPNLDPDLSSDSTDEAESREASSQLPAEMDRLIWQGKVWPAFWTVGAVFSIGLNVILVVVVILLGRHLFEIKSLVSEQLIGGLYDNFVLMDNANIVTQVKVEDTIQVDDTIPVVFDLPLSQQTDVVLARDTPIDNATIILNGAQVPLDLVLRKGTVLNIQLDLVVPVSQTVPVKLDVPVALEVPVDIPLKQTELHDPFVGLQKVVLPYSQSLNQLPGSWYETPFCTPWTEVFCGWIFGKD
jgi:hypothetical protein